MNIISDLKDIGTWLNTTKEEVRVAIVGIVFSSIGFISSFIWENLTIFITSLIVITILVGFIIFKSKKSKKKYFSKIRQKQINRLIGNIKTGQSSAIVGAFGQERTSILTYLEENSSEIFGRQNNTLIFSHLDLSSDFSKTDNQIIFWKKALQILQDKFSDDINSSVIKAYNTCKEHDFDSLYLRKLNEQLKQNGLRLVLLLDRFDVSLDGVLNNEKFFTGLRTLASEASSPLCLVITTNEPIWQIHQDTKELIGRGSPYLNFLEPGTITLGRITKQEVQELLNIYNFSNNDKFFLKNIAGDHPFLLKTAIEQLNQEYEEEFGRQNPYVLSILRLIFSKRVTKVIENARENFSEYVENRLTDILQSWSPNLCKAFIAVAQENDTYGFDKEIKELNRQGFLIKEGGNWQVSNSIFKDILSKDSITKLCQK
ncbi:MAG: hypothetical protein QM487_03650 [Candidatus Marithrix sp.]